MEDDFTEKPTESICSDAVGLAISEWATVANEYLQKTEQIQEILFEVFRSRNEMLSYQKEVKYYLMKGLKPVDQESIQEGSKIRGKRNQSPDEKALIKRRTVLLQRVNVLFKRLLDEIFPRMTDDIHPLKTTPVSTPDAGIQNQVDNTKEEESSPRGVSLEEAFENNKSGNQDDDENQDGGDEEEEVAVDVKQSSRHRFGKQKQHLNKVDPDLFETSAELLSMLKDEVVPAIRENNWTVLEPCAGKDAIVNYFQEYGINVIARDKYTKPESHDVLKDPMPEGVDLVVTNPPFNLKFEILARLIDYGKPFILLLPLDTASTKRFHRIVGATKFDLLIPIGRSRFLHAGEWRDVGPVAWYLFSPAAANTMTYKHLGADDDKDLGSEDTEGGRDYDMDEQSQKRRDQAILNDSKTEFTNEGYVQDGFVMNNPLENGV